MIKKIKCKICGKNFEIEGQNHNGFFRPNLSPYNTKICSENCRRENSLRLAKAQGLRKKEKIIKRNCRYCKKEVISTQYCPRSFCNGKAGECYKKFLSETRKGKNNPAYRNGLAVGKNRKYTGKHLRACSKYRKMFLSINQYLFCQICGINGNGTPRFEVHHIYYASLYPKHKELHNPLNLILLCIGCHNDLHSGKMRSKIFQKLERDRGLKQLFKGRKL